MIHTGASTMTSATRVVTNRNIHAARRFVKREVLPVVIEGLPCSPGVLFPEEAQE
jgi:hypothetical protein